MSLGPHHTLDLLVRHELALKQLYLACAAAFADVGEFWRTLAGEEQGHADRLSGLRSDPALDQWLTADLNLRPQAIASSIEYVNTQTSKVQADGMTLVQALAVAKDMEEALIDRQWLLPSSPDCAEIAMVLSALRAETERHRRLVVDALDTEKRLHS